MLQRAVENSDEGLRELEQHCSAQLQHGLDALGANMEHLIENGTLWDDLYALSLHY